ncbi:excinuclease ABC subunit UvrC [Candidatus Contubernalis alkaliaceticus]|uniref:excinuclease ABC subunit UvrC n=1 Tax=Candidatus Contubernalis alkaliaceticus TaxID=338645 RepID=UPI001F4C41F0|nr:excinuclease ABC subunit UvrC [Candidatus Contubernalis alkalaceticus]UNC90782.1 excinuclease ABC subunit UvrC [Candidatus Contubernalis alkalaceticus]
MRLEDRPVNLPDQPGVYIFKNKNGEVIYVGKAVSLQNRVRSYFQNNSLDTKSQAMMGHARDLDYIVTGTEVEALILENSLIKQYKPRYNVSLKDDKQYPYLKITLSEEYPRLLLTRKIEKDGSRYFGPYTNVKSLRETLKVLKKVLPLRSCKEKFRVRGKERPCLNYHLKYCLAPCQGEVSPEQYGGLVKDLTLFLEGRQEKLLRRLEREMHGAAAELNFEKAAALRDKHQGLSGLVSRQKVVSPKLKDLDVIGYSQAEQETFMQVFLIRQGKIVGKEQFTLTNTQGLKAREILTAFIKQYYNSSTAVPAEILTPAVVSEKEVLESWLSQRRGAKAAILCPQRGLKKELIDMADQNAILFMEEKAQKEKNIISLLKEVKQILGLLEIPFRIEGFDVSNLQGSKIVASMVVFEGGIPLRSAYRRFKMEEQQGPDDYLALNSALTRRLKGALREQQEVSEGHLTLDSAKFLPLPELILIDGGKGQLKAALEALQELEFESQINLVSLAKKEEHLFLPGEKSPLVLPSNSSVLKLMQQVRDEAHRFALSYHRLLRDKDAMNSVLTRIKGVGEKRQKNLLMHFGSVKKISQASVDELCLVPGMDSKTAQEIYSYFNAFFNR